MADLPSCGGTKVWRLEAEAWTDECVCCGRQTSVTPGTIMHHSKLPLSTRFYPNGFRPGRQIKLSKSTEGGTSFGPLVVVTDITAVGDGFVVQGLFRDGQLFTVFHDRRLRQG
jgi:hypothetical protein